MKEAGSLLVELLENQKVDRVFCVPGESYLSVMNGLQETSIETILCKHEGAASIMAEADGKLTGRPGIAFVTRGPGATNAVTALTDAYMDSIPIICITGQVPTHLIGTDAFQECDTTGITRPCTKHNWLVKDVNKLSSIMHKAFEVATTGRPGPVLIDIPKDIQFQKGNYIKPKELKNNNSKISIKFNGQDKDIENAVEFIKKSSNISSLLLGKY